MINLSSAELDDRRALLDEGRALVYHLAEGQQRQQGGPRVRRRRDRRLPSAPPDRDSLLRRRRRRVPAVERARRPQRRHRPGGVVWSPFSNLWLYDQTTDVMAARTHGVSVCIGSDWGPSGSKNLLGELKVAHTWVRHAGLDLTPFDLAEMVTSNPGDLLARAWARPGARSVGAGAYGRRRGGRQALRRPVDEPRCSPASATSCWSIGDGQPRYGTAALMKAAGATAHDEHARRVGDTPRSCSTIPADPTKRWTWSAVIEPTAQRCKPTR